MKRQPVPHDPLATLTAQALFANERKPSANHAAAVPERWRRRAGRWLAGIRGSRTPTKDNT